MRTFKGFQKGINLGGWLSQSSLKKEHLDTFITEEDIARIASIGADHVRLPVDYPLIETEEGEVIEAGYAYIDRCVEWCEKHGLGMILDLHRTAGYAFQEADSSGSFFYNIPLQERFLSLWDRMSARYGKYGFIAFDLLNEVVDPGVSDAWNGIAARAVKRIRKHAPSAWILIGGTYYNSIHEVKNILPPPDDRIVYSFHFYEPLIFTHQGGYWVHNMKEDFRVSYPLTAGKYTEISKSSLNGSFSGIFSKMDASAEGIGMLGPLFEEALAVSESRNVPLYCGEYGVINLADTQSALAWHRDIHAVFEKHGIGRALWCYKAMDFGLVDDHYRDAFGELVTLL